MDFVQAIVAWGLVALAGLMLAGVLAGIKNRDLSFWMSWCFFDTAVRRVPHVLTKVSGTPAASPGARSFSLKIGEQQRFPHKRMTRLTDHSDADNNLPRVQPGGLAWTIRRGVS